MSELLEKILSKENMNAAYKRVCANKGAGGVDGVTVEELGDYIKEHWRSIREQIRQRQYKPQPVRRVEIPKQNGGVRKLGIPTVMDRVIQQGIVQVINPMCEPLFSEWSYGFRPNRSCEMAIRQLLIYLNEGYEWIVDIDLEKFFDNVPQDRLMSLVHVIINDGDTESLIRKYLKAGVMTPQGYEETRLGTPQGGNLSPLLCKKSHANGIGLDTEKTWAKSQHDQNSHHKTIKAEISWLRFLQGQQDKRVEM